MTTSHDESNRRSETTGLQPLGQHLGKLIGSQPGAIGSVATRAEAPALAKLTPQETDARVAASLEHISGHRPSFKRRTLFPESGPIYSICEAASWRCGSAVEQQEALRAVEYSLRPAGEDDLGAALYSLRIMTRGRERYEADDREAEAIVWLQQLRKYPADIALHVIREWPTRSDGQWWPTWHDVQKELEGQTSARRLLAAHIRSGGCLVKPSADPDRDDSPEGVAHRKAVVAREMAKMPPKEKPPTGPVDPINPVDAYDEWEARTKADLEKEQKSGKFKISAEALNALTPMISTAEYQAWLKSNETESSTPSLPETNGMAA